jgi:putative ABC transport system ATP-binding protein
MTTPNSVLSDPPPSESLTGLHNGSNGDGTATAPAVHIQNLNHRFGQGELSQQVLFNIDLKINPGELVILTGPSGCGKTTLLTLVGALRAVQEGSVRVLGREMRGLNQRALIDARRDIGFIFQAHNLLEALSAGENVALALDLKSHTPDSLHEHAARLLAIFQDGAEGANPLNGVAHETQAAGRALVTGLLTHLQLGARVNHKPTQMSGGQKQRVAIARALANHPRLILADEPTAALDKVASFIVLDMLTRLTQHGSTILVVTHDNRIMDQGSRVVTMKDGRIASNIEVDATVRICIFLQKVPIFAKLTPSHLVDLAKEVGTEVHPAGATIIRQGESGDKFYMIKEGKVEVFVEQGGPPQLVNTLDSGQFFGEVALLEDQPRNATVTAKGQVELYTLSKREFQRAQATFEPVREELMKVFAHRYRGD